MCKSRSWLPEGLTHGCKASEKMFHAPTQLSGLQLFEFDLDKNRLGFSTVSRKFVLRDDESRKEATAVDAQESYLDLRCCRNRRVDNVPLLSVMGSCRRLAVPPLPPRQQ
ncbi:hypothetical protein PoB_006068700 [Plakobranchus ocellatus]|uniref:Uncharacterized protein n=1 Tax=Plakobranchus ocellatus TaxID=259542 RepID=A0AAV4CQM6_9GAST|nr:hypothetical protein PoB_006068700 [Plakobranchus ocellatus]